MFLQHHIQNFTTVLFRLAIVSILFTSCDSDIPKNIRMAYKELPDQIDFNFHVRPILSDRCYACHGPDEKARKAKFRLDNEEGAFAALKNSEGFAFVAGQPMESKSIHRILSEDKDLMMPPPESEMHLTKVEKAIIYKWIKQGAKWKKHWAFIPPNKANAISYDQIDDFIKEGLKKQGLQGSAPAPKTQWLRRVTFDITGLPPKVEDIENFLQEDSDEAYEKVVDRLLASAAYGERMASVWLDVARYADSHGYQDDRPRTMWPWRDWVIKAFNNNLPYDQFATWQIAGDLLPDVTYDQKLATGFNRNHAITQEGGVVQEEYLTEYAADRTHTFSTAFLGLTMQCARCHSHKYDPILQDEYYSMFSFFNNISERGQINYFDEAPTPNMGMQDSLMDQEVEQIKNLIAQKENSLQQLRNQPTDEFDNWLLQPQATKDLTLQLQKGLLADFRLNEEVPGQYHSEVKDQATGRMNINLPPRIPMPSTVSGKEGKALQFDGDNFLSLGEIGDFEWHDAFSLGAWIKHSNTHKKNAGLLSRRVGEQKRQGYDFVLSPNNTLTARLIHQYVPKNKNFKGIRYAIDVESQSRVPANQWQHVFMTYDGSGKAAGLNIYLNGKKQPLKIKMDSLRGRTILTGNDFLVGHWNHRARELGDLYGFKGGAIDNVRLYNRELSAIEVAAITKPNATKSNPPRAQLYAYYLQHSSPAFRQISHELDSLRRIDLTQPKVMIMEEVDTMKATFVLDRGAYDAPAEKIQRATPKAVMAFNESFPPNRLGLANWLFQEDHPLASRVIVNRFWQLFFGKGLVATPEDFGNQGALPSHPKLLDLMAVNFQASGWDMKALVKTIVLSNTYRQNAYLNPTLVKKDKTNTWLARGPSQRLTAEMLRDQALAVSGLYYEKLGGKWVKPYQPPGIWKELANQIGENKYRPSQGRDLYRRSLYSYWKRTIPPPSMLTFDASERAECTVKRQQTSTPLQSLILFNDPIYTEAARYMAEQYIKQDDDKKEQIGNAFYRIISRKGEEKEIKLLQELYQQELERFEATPNEAKALLEVGASTYDPQLNKSALAALTVVINTIFNLDEAKFR